MGDEAFAELYVRSLNASPRSGNGLMGAQATRADAVQHRPVRERARLGRVGHPGVGEATRRGRAGGVITHPEMTRSFLTIPGAASRVIQAGPPSPDEAPGADVFVLDMGEPLLIVELAERLVRLHGHTPLIAERGRDITERGGAGVMPIVFTGVRPGEKIHEELAHASEELRPTPARGCRPGPPGGGPRPGVRLMIEELRGHPPRHQPRAGAGRRPPPVPDRGRTRTKR